MLKSVPHFEEPDDRLNSAYKEIFLLRQQIADLEEQNRRLNIKASTDGLTGLWNHAQFQGVLDCEVERSLRSLTPVALLMMDVDNFKQVNSRYGHQMGDQILQKVGEALRYRRRKNDTVARYGGEEFAVILPGVDLLSAVQVAESIRVHIMNTISIEREPLTISVGVSSCPHNATEAQDLVRDADFFLRQAKTKGGKNCVKWSTGG